MEDPKAEQMGRPRERQLESFDLGKATAWDYEVAAATKQKPALELLEDLLKTGTVKDSEEAKKTIDGFLKNSKPLVSAPKSKITVIKPKSAVENYSFTEGTKKGGGQVGTIEDLLAVASNPDFITDMKRQAATSFETGAQSIIALGAVRIANIPPDPVWNPAGGKQALVICLTVSKEGEIAIRENVRQDFWRKETAFLITEGNNTETAKP
jgi:hypothetical protein